MIAVSKNPIISQATDFQEKFNRSHFRFAHSLVNHPLFELPRLQKLADTLLNSEKGGVLCQSGKTDVRQRWTDLPLKERVMESLSDVEESESRVLMTVTQTDPEYNLLLNQILDELTNFTGVDIRQNISWIDAYIFVSSPQSTTPYHIDHESNFLFQVRGEKEVNLFEQNDRSILTEPEIEGYYVGDLAAAVYKPENQSKGTVYSLLPGDGVHHPINAPHWVRTKGSVSVTLSVLFFMKSSDRIARVYQTNHYLRKLGFQPTPPGQSIYKDTAKIFTLGLLSKRHPKTKYEVIRSGITRVQASARWLSQLSKQ